MLRSPIPKGLNCSRTDVTARAWPGTSPPWPPASAVPARESDFTWAAPAFRDVAAIWSGISVVLPESSHQLHWLIDQPWDGALKKDAGSSQDSLKNPCGWKSLRRRQFQKSKLTSSCCPVDRVACPLTRAPSSSITTAAGTAAGASPPRYTSDATRRVAPTQCCADHICCLRWGGCSVAANG